MNIQKIKIADYLCAFLSTALFISLNNITFTLFDIPQIASPLILFSSLILISILGVKKASFSNIGVKLMYLFFLIYYILGFLVRLYYIEIEYQVDFKLILNNFLTSLLIIISFHQYLYNRLIINPSEKKVFLILFYPVFISCLFSTYLAHIGIANIIGETNGRIMGVYSNPNTLGFVCNIGMCCALYGIYKSHFKVMYGSLLIVLFLYVSFLCLSRAAMISNFFLILLSIGWIGVKMKDLTRRIIYKYLLLSALPILSVFYVANNFDRILIEYTDQWKAKKIKGMVNIFLKGEITTENTADRNVAVKFGLTQVKAKPLFGNGLSYFAHFPKATGHDYGVHNTHLLILGDTGIFSFFIYISFMLYVFIRSIMIEPIIGLFSFALMSLWLLQGMSGHNCLDEKMFNIMMVYAIMYLVYGLDISTPTISLQNSK